MNEKEIQEIKSRNERFFASILGLSFGVGIWGWLIIFASFMIFPYSFKIAGFFLITSSYAWLILGLLEISKRQKALKQIQLNKKEVKTNGTKNTERRSENLRR